MDSKDLRKETYDYIMGLGVKMTGEVRKKIKELIFLHADTKLAEVIKENNELKDKNNHLTNLLKQRPTKIVEKEQPKSAFSIPKNVKQMYKM